MIIKKIINDNSLINERIDLVLPTLEETLTRSKVQKLIKDEKIKVNGEVIKANYKVSLNDEIVIDISISEDLKPEKIPLEIIYEDDDLLVINKQRGLVVHPGNGNHEHTLVNALLYHVKELSNIDSSRPGIVHRIDKDTSGLLVIAKTNFAHLALAKQLLDHTMHREYKALVKGVINEDTGKIIAPIARDKSNPLLMSVDVNRGKEAETTFKVIERYKDATLVEAKLKQGRTHQIRVHFNYIKHPLIGDTLYGKDNRNIIKDGQILHAYKISFIHPRNKKEMSFTSPLPKYFIDAVNLFKSF